jgi:hypothetical protein
MLSTRQRVITVWCREHHSGVSVFQLAPQTQVFIWFECQTHVRSLGITRMTIAVNTVFAAPPIDDVLESISDAELLLGNPGRN